MLLGVNTAASAETTLPGKPDGIDNEEVLEFLQLVEQLKRAAALLSIEPAGGKPRPKRLTRA
jgi:hypothetical protein